MIRHFLSVMYEGQLSGGRIYPGQTGKCIQKTCPGETEEGAEKQHYLQRLWLCRARFAIHLTKYVFDSLVIMHYNSASS